MALIYVKESGKRSAAAVRATMWLCLHWRWESAWWKGLKESKGWGNQYKNVMLSVSSMFSTVHEQQWKVAWKLIQHNSFLKRSLRRNLAFFYYFSSAEMIQPTHLDEVRTVSLCRFPCKNTVCFSLSSVTHKAFDMTSHKPPQLLGYLGDSCDSFVPLHKYLSPLRNKIIWGWIV